MVGVHNGDADSRRLCCDDLIDLIDLIESYTVTAAGCTYARLTGLADTRCGAPLRS
jgi:hypothetical protein